MEPVLILVDTDRISQEKSILDQAVPYMQEVYDAFTAQNISVTVQDIVNFKQWCSSGRDFLKTVENFISSQLVLRAAPAANFNGVPIQTEKLRDMIIMPDTTEIKTAITTLANRVQGYNGLNVRPNLLVLNNGVIAKVADADAQLTAEFTFYTKTDAGAQLATDLLPIVDALNNIKVKYKGYLPDFPDPTGLVTRNGALVLDLNFIRKYEQLKSN